MVWHMQVIHYLKNDDFTFQSTATSRAFYAWMNFESPVTSDPAVHKAITMGIDKESFVSVLLNGYGYPAVGAFSGIRSLLVERI